MNVINVEADQGTPRKHFSWRSMVSNMTGTMLDGGK